MGQTTFENLKLTAETKGFTFNFGHSLAISGSIAIVGAYNANGIVDRAGAVYVTDDDLGTNSGSAYIVDIKTGQELVKLTASNSADNDQFGFAVSISGQLALVGSLQDDDFLTNTGSAYFFDIATGQQLVKRIDSEPGVGAALGRSVDLSGNIALAGATGLDGPLTDTGPAYIYRSNTNAPCPADLTGEGDFDFFDVSAFLAAFSQGCHNQTPPTPNLKSPTPVNFAEPSGKVHQFILTPTPNPQPPPTIPHARPNGTLQNTHQRAQARAAHRAP